MPIWFGGDYNPEQWPESVWDEDIELMTRARVSLVTVGVFSWAMLEPREGEFEFSWLDRILDKLHEAGIRVDLATATASPPPWLTHNYPEVLPVNEAGVRLEVGSRQQYCPSSPVYRRLAQRLAATIAERYRDHPAVEMWHINNEYGCHLSHCYCDVSARSFRRWLQSKYGSIDALNEAWGTAFWSQRYGSFDEVRTPSLAPYFRNPGQLLDFDRFSSAELLECFRSEVAVVRRHSPDLPITTNFMGFFKPVDYWSWASEIDIISDDSYPDPADSASPMLAAMTRDLMRSLAGGKPWMLMEQAANAVNWRPTNAAKRPGMMRAWSYQAVARGADGVLFFQWRQSDRGGERFHSAMLPHSGTASRSWSEIEALGSELEDASTTITGSVEARVAIVFDWESWWSLDQSGLPARINYLEQIAAWYRPFFEAGVTIDFVSTKHELDSYSMVLAPALFAVDPPELDRLGDYVQAGGHLVVGFQSGITDRTGRLMPGGFLGPLTRTLGVRIDEFVPLGPNSSVPIEGGTAELWSERLIVDSATVLRRYVGGDLDGCAAVTRNEVGRGTATYLGTVLAPTDLAEIFQMTMRDAKVEAHPAAGPNTEVVVRGDRTFIIDHAQNTVAIH